MEGGRKPPHSTAGAAANGPNPKFSVYQNQKFSAALTATSLRPSAATLLLIFSSSLASAISLLAITSREERLFKYLTRIHVSPDAALLLAKALQGAVGLAFVATLSALIRALSLRNAMHSSPPSKKPKEQQNLLTQRQLGLLGFKPKPAEQVDGETLKKYPKSRPVSSLSASDALVHIRKSAFDYTPTRPPRIVSDQQSTSGGKKVSMSPISSSPPSQYVTSLATPWSRQSSGSAKGIQTEAMLEQFLADVDEKITESEAKAAASSPTAHEFGIASPGSVATSTTTSGAARSTPLRPVRMSPGSHKKYSTPPKKGEGELPPPMLMEQAAEAFESLGIYPQIEQWRDRLRQWFSSFLLNPLLEKIETSHIQVMQAAANVGVPITVSQVGSDSPNTITPVNVSPIDGSKEWRPTFTLDEDGLLHQLRAALVQARDGSIYTAHLISQQQLQHNPQLPVIQACLDAITEHQRLKTLMKGELVKGLLPQSSVRADYTVQRVRELAEGTCLKNYDYLGTGDGYERVDKKWMIELPTDSHLLLYLFCAFLEHLKWMLHVDPASYSGAQSSKNPLFLGILPPKDRFPEKYVAIISGVPPIIHPGACILSVGKQSPPVFALYWDKKLQFSLQVWLYEHTNMFQLDPNRRCLYPRMFRWYTTTCPRRDAFLDHFVSLRPEDGRTALWDALLLLCHRIKIGYDGVVRGVHLGSSALNILPVLDLDNES